MTDWEVFNVDCRDLARLSDPEFAQCIVTSPPYFGLRSYEGLPPTSWNDGWFGCLGNEPDPTQYIAHMVEVFEGLRRVLANDGVCWLNLGDSFASAGGPEPPQTKWLVDGASATMANGRNRRPPTGMKPKDLMLIPHRVAIALQEAGWYVRMDVVWHKPNPMPESVRDRPTKAHEYVFMLTKSAKYYYDAEAVRETPVYAKPTGTKKGARRVRNVGGRTDGFTRISQGGGVGCPEGGRNRRSVWKIATKGYKGAHFAVMPEALAEVCVLAGSRPGDLVFDPFCGSGTTGVVALRHGRSFAGCEASAKYAELARSRIADSV